MFTMWRRELELLGRIWMAITAKPALVLLWTNCSVVCASFMIPYQSSLYSYDVITEKKLIVYEFLFCACLNNPSVILFISLTLLCVPALRIYCLISCFFRLSYLRFLKLWNKHHHHHQFSSQEDLRMTVW